MNVIEFIGSFLSGGVMSLIIWFLTTKWLSPKMILSDNVSRTPVVGGDKKRYFLKIQNGSCHRNIYNISCYVRYHFSNDSFYSETFAPIPLLQCKDGEDECGFERKLELKNINLSKVSSSIQQKYADFEMTKKSEIKRTEILNAETDKTCGKKELQVNIDDFFEKEGENGYIEIIVICYDAFSGAKRCVLSKKFRFNDLLDGDFRRGSMKVEKNEPDSFIENYADNNS